MMHSVKCCIFGFSRMYNKIIEFTEFKKLQEDTQHHRYWETEYKSHTKEMLLNQLLEQQENNYPLMQKSSKDNKQFHALVNVLEEKATTPWLKQILGSLRDNAVEAYRKFSLQN